MNYQQIIMYTLFLVLQFNFFGLSNQFLYKNLIANPNEPQDFQLSEYRRLIAPMGPTKRRLISAGVDPFLETLLESTDYDYYTDRNMTLVQSFLEAVDKSANGLLASIEVEKMKKNAEKKAEDAIKSAEKDIKDFQKQAENLYKEAERSFKEELDSLIKITESLQEDADKAFANAEKVEKSEVRKAKNISDSAFRTAKTTGDKAFAESDKVKRDADREAQKVIKAQETVFKKVEREYITSKNNLEKQIENIAKKQADWEEAFKKWEESPENKFAISKLEKARSAYDDAQIDLNFAKGEFYKIEIEFNQAESLYNHVLRIETEKADAAHQESYNYASYVNETAYIDAEYITKDAYKKAEEIYSPSYHEAYNLQNITNQSQKELDAKKAQMDAHLAAYQNQLRDEVHTFTDTAFRQAEKDARIAEIELQLLIHGEKLAFLTGQESSDSLRDYDWTEAQIAWLSDLFDFDFNEVLASS